MATGSTYILKSATFGSAITGLSNISISQGGSPVDLNDDAAVEISDVFVDNLAVDVTLETNDLAQVDSLSVGDADSLVLVFQKRENGTGAVAAADLTATIANAVVTSIDSAGPHEGTGTNSVTFRAPAAVWS